jgi:mono/diheme cytochrome c family protein
MKYSLGCIKFRAKHGPSRHCAGLDVQGAAGLLLWRSADRRYSHGKGLLMKISASMLARSLAVAGAVTLASGAGLVGLSGLSNVNAQPAAAPPTDEYTTIVQPIFIANCTKCHNDTRGRGGLSLESPAGILKGGRMDGAVIVPGHPEKSLLVSLIRHEGPADDPMPMPPPPHDKLSDTDIAAVTKWIQDGAVMPQ